MEKECKFNLVSSEDKENVIEFCTTNTEYEKVVREAVDKGVLKISFEKNKVTTIKIWVENLLPDYGPYYYGVLKYFNEILVLSSSLDSFNKDDSVPLERGFFLGWFDLPENHKFNFFDNGDWIYYFKNIDEKDLIVMFRRFEKKQVLKLIEGGAKIHPSEMKYIGGASKYAFQFSKYDHIDV